MPELSRAEVVAVLQRTGHFAEIDKAKAILPDPVDLERDQGLLEKLGLSKSQLMDDMGGSP